MTTSPAAATPGPIAVIDGPLAHLSVSPSEHRRAAVTLGLGYGGPSTMHLTRDKAVELVEAIRIQLRESDCSARCAAEVDRDGESDPGRGWHRDDCPAQLERSTVEELYGVITELRLQLDEAAGR